MRKQTFKYIFSAMMLVLVASCDVTDLQPLEVISQDQAFATEANIELSVVGLYDAAQSGFYGGNENQNRGYIFGAAYVEQGDMRGEDFTLINVFYDLTYRATYTTSTANNVNYWENGFRIINISNLVQEGVAGAVEAGIIDEAVGNAYIGEARLIRGMTYHTLLTHFARPYRDGNGSALGLPIFTQGVDNPEAAALVPETGRSTVAEVYDFILEDLNFAETNLPATRAGQLHVTRATKGAAIGLKTRVYLHMGEWESVITEGEKLVAGAAPFTSTVGGYKLGESPETPFKDNFSTESIFSMDMSTTDNLDTNSALARMIGSPADGARGEYVISPIIWNQTFWHEDDLRRTEILVHTDETETADATKYYTHKYRDYTGWTDRTPLVRLAEVILNLAEAESRTGGSARALELLNGIRNRAIPEPPTTMVPYVAGDFGSDTELTQAILNERRIELLGEGHRWEDIHRNAVDPDFTTGGIPAKMTVADLVDLSTYTIGQTPTTPIAAIPYADYRFLWPIPQSETTRNATLAAQQNPGY